MTTELLRFLVLEGSDGMWYMEEQMVSIDDQDVETAGVWQTKFSQRASREDLLATFISFCSNSVGYSLPVLENNLIVNPLFGPGEQFMITARWSPVGHFRHFQFSYHPITISKPKLNLLTLAQDILGA